jgi:hypothetical protein
MLTLSVKSNAGQDTLPKNCYGSNFKFSIPTYLTFLLLFPFYDTNTINLHVLMVLSIGGIVNAMLLPEVVFFSFYSSMQHFKRKSAIGVKFPRRFFP